jgi:hypothetical protein
MIGARAPVQVISYEEHSTSHVESVSRSQQDPDRVDQTNTQARLNPS